MLLNKVNKRAGLVVPIPTFPADVIRSRSAAFPKNLYSKLALLSLSNSSYIIMNYLNHQPVIYTCRSWALVAVTRELSKLNLYLPQRVSDQDLLYLYLRFQWYYYSLNCINCGCRPLLTAISKIFRICDSYTHTFVQF